MFSCSNPAFGLLYEINQSDQKHSFSGSLQIKLVTSFVFRCLNAVNWPSDELLVNVAGGAFSVVDNMSLILFAKKVANESAVSCVIGVADF